MTGSPGLCTEAERQPALRGRVAVAVATVAVDGAKNAALLAVQILAITDAELAAKLDKAREDGKAAVLKADAEVMARFQ